MTTLNQLFEDDAYTLGGGDKSAVICDHLGHLAEHHYAHCPPYKALCDAFGADTAKPITNANEAFSLPVRIFKHYELKSIIDDSNVKTLTSSGTTSQQVSKIFLDKQTSQYQTKALSCIMRSYLGPKRLPMIILDSDAILKNRQMFSARGGGILGMSNFGRKHLYLFDEDMKVKYDALDEFLEQHADTPIFLFGFTFMIWLHLIKELEKTGKTLNIENATMVHSGGWKKLESEKVDNSAFRQRVSAATGIERIYNFYGMVEQMGSVYMECEQGHFHASVFSEVIIRDPLTGEALGVGEQGVIETLSILPHSYPGHAILTEDQGLIHGRDDCKCGRNGTHFSILGRLPKAEVRGCSDTYES